MYIDICQEKNYIYSDICQFYYAEVIMPRTTKCRRIYGFPDFYSFIPEDADADRIETITLS